MSSLRETIREKRCTRASYNGNPRQGSCHRAQGDRTTSRERCGDIGSSTNVRYLFVYDTEVCALNLSSLSRSAKRPATINHDGPEQDRPEAGKQNVPQVSPPIMQPPPASSGLGDPYLTNDRIISQILQPVSLPSPSHISDPDHNFPSPLDRQQLHNNDMYPSPGISAGYGSSMQVPFPQPSLAHLAQPAQHPNMDRLLQAVSTSHWVEPSFQGKTGYEALQPGYHANVQSGTPSTYESSQIPTGYINLGVPTSAMVPEQVNVEEGMADVFGWGVNSTEWMQLYDSMGMDSNLVAPAETPYPHPPRTYIPAVNQSYPVTQQDIVTGSPVWISDPHQHLQQIQRHSVPEGPSHLRTRIQRRPSAQAYQGTESPLGSVTHDHTGNVEYGLPSELSNNQEAYPSRTSLINRDIQLMSSNNRSAALGDAYTSDDMIPGRNTRQPTNEVVYGEEGTPWVSR